MEQETSLAKALLRLLKKVLTRLLKVALNLLSLLLSVTGVFCISFGSKTAITDNLGLGLMLVAIGGCLILLDRGIRIVCRFCFWRHYIRRKGLEDSIRVNTQSALQAYNSCPGKLTRLYISRLNPDAGNAIRENSTFKK